MSLLQIEEIEFLLVSQSFQLSVRHRQMLLPMLLSLMWLLLREASYLLKTLALMVWDKKLSTHFAVADDEHDFAFEMCTCHRNAATKTSRFLLLLNSCCFGTKKIRNVFVLTAKTIAAFLTFRRENAEIKNKFVNVKKK